MNYCWYTEGGAFQSGFASRQEAVNAAFDEEEPWAIIGTAIDPVDLVATTLSADEIVEYLTERAPFDGLDASFFARDGADEALTEWVRKYLDHEFNRACIDGTDPTPEEWEAARLAAEIPERGSK